MKFHFDPDLDYQRNAIDAVMRLFEGAPDPKGFSKPLGLHRRSGGTGGLGGRREDRETRYERDRYTEAKMNCTPSEVRLGDTGDEIYFSQTDCALVEFWRRKYGAKVKVEWAPEAERPLLYESGELPMPMTSGPKLKEGDTVWAVSHSVLGAFHDASLIKRFVSTTSAEEYKRVRRDLERAGYPEEILSVIPSP